MRCRMCAPVKLSNISIHSADVVGCSSKKVLILHVLSLAVCTASWSGHTHRHKHKHKHTCRDMFLGCLNCCNIFSKYNFL